MADELFERVMAGSYQNHVMPFFWQKGESHETITAYLEKIAAADIHEVCLESRTHPDFCGPGWWEDLSFIIAECKRLGLKIWLLDDAHFPTGMANNWITERYPECRRTVLKQRSFDVMGPAPARSVVVHNPLSATDEFVGAVALQDGAWVPVEFTRVPGDGFDEATRAAAAQDPRAGFMAFKQTGVAPERLVFDAPAGVTRIVLLYTARQTGWRDEYINMVDKASCDVLIKAIYEPHYEHVGSEFGKTILGFFTDEPGFMNEKGVADAEGCADSLIGKADMALPWSDELARRLREALGEEAATDERFLAQLALLWTRRPEGARARHAYMDVATRLYRACFDENIGGWCRAHGVMHIGHVIEDKDYHARLGQGAGHYFRAVAGQDMAGVDVVINQLVPGLDHGLHSYGRGVWDMEFFNYGLAKLGSSAAHLDPKKQGRCMAEVFGAFGWREGLREMKWIADHMLVRGVNYFVPHAFSMAEFPDLDCPPHFYARGNNPQFRYFGKLMSYMNRMGTLLSGGEAHPQVAVLYHADAEWAGAAMQVQRVASELTRHQIDFDIVPAEAFSDADRYQVACAGRAADAGSRDAAPRFSINGQAYRALVVPCCEYLGRDTVAFIERARAAGVPVLVVDALPSGIYDGAPAEGGASLAARLEDALTVVPRGDLAAALRRAGIGELTASVDVPWLRSYHYTQSGDGRRAPEDYWMLVNEHPCEPLAADLAVDGRPLTGVRLDVLNGSRAPFSGHLELAPYESCVVVAGGQAAVPAADQALAGGVMRLAGPWQVAFADAKSYPVFDDPRTLDALCDLTPVYPGKAGTFRYACTFTLDADGVQAVLDLGTVGETAAVSIDGVERGVRIAPPYSFELGDLAAGAHELEVEVTGTLDHSTLDMLSVGEVAEPIGLMGPVALSY